MAVADYVDASPGQLAQQILRDGRPRDAINQLIRINDVVRVWTPQSGWSSTRDYFIKHILPVWSLVGSYQRYSYLLTPFVEEEGQENTNPSDPEEVTIDAIEILDTTVIFITADDLIAIREGIGQEKVRVVAEDSELVRMKVGEYGVIYNTDVTAP
jgi:hypothetical protein